MFLGREKAYNAGNNFHIYCYIFWSNISVLENLLQLKPKKEIHGQHCQSADMMPCKI
jgi:hypothetical protein